MSRVSGARATAESLLHQLGDRWKHVQAVADRAAQLAEYLPDSEREPLLASAWLHDVGYAPGLSVSGFHPLDGAAFLAAHGWEARVCSLVAHHSCSDFEADERGLTDALNVWPREMGEVMDMLITADMTTGPRGEPLTVDDRIAEILTRYPRTSPVHRAIQRASAEVKAAVERTEKRTRPSA